MLETLRSAVVARLADRWLLTSPASWFNLQVPSGPLVTRSEGPDPDRVLLFGSGIAVGYGMSSHDLALAGQLGRQISEATGRGTEVEVITGEKITVDNALRKLTVKRLREFDAIVVTPGSLERLLLISTTIWRRRVKVLLDHFGANAPASLRVFFVGMPELSKIANVPRLLGWLADSSSRSLNRVLEDSCAKYPYAQYVPFDPTERSALKGTGRTYRYWATFIAPAVAVALDEYEKVSH